MKEQFKKALEHSIPIIISALIAGLIGFLQSMLSQMGACDLPPVGFEETAYIGGSIKALHTSFRWFKPLA